MITSPPWAAEAIGVLHGHSGLGVYIRVYIRVYITPSPVCSLLESASSDDGVTLHGSGAWRVAYIGAGSGGRMEVAVRVGFEH